MATSETETSSWSRSAERPLYWFLIAGLSLGWAGTAWKLRESAGSARAETRVIPQPAGVPEAVPALSQPMMADGTSPPVTETPATVIDAAEEERTKRFIETGLLEEARVPTSIAHLFGVDAGMNTVLDGDSLLPDEEHLKKLGLDERARQTVHECFSTILGRWQAAEKAHSRIVSDAENNRTVVIEPFAETRQDIEREFRQQLSEAVGSSLAWHLARPYASWFMFGRGRVELWWESDTGTSRPIVIEKGPNWEKMSDLAPALLTARYGHLFQETEGSGP